MIMKLLITTESNSILGGGGGGGYGKGDERTEQDGGRGKGRVGNVWRKGSSSLCLSLSPSIYTPLSVFYGNVCCCCVAISAKLSCRAIYTANQIDIFFFIFVRCYSPLAMVVVHTEDAALLHHFPSEWPKCSFGHGKCPDNSFWRLHPPLCYFGEQPLPAGLMKEGPGCPPARIISVGAPPHPPRFPDSESLVSLHSSSYNSRQTCQHFIVFFFLYPVCLYVVFIPVSLYVVFFSSSPVVRALTAFNATNLLKASLLSFA